MGRLLLKVCLQSGTWCHHSYWEIFIDKIEYTVTSLNIISKTVKVENDDDVKFLSLDDFRKQTGQTKFFRKQSNEKK